MAKLIVGLGNPGNQYKNTRHNAGFIAIDKLLEDYTIINSKESFNAQLFFTNVKGEKVIFVKPQTYMNLSGEAVALILNYYKIDIQDMIIIYDDKDLPIGKMRFREQGSAGGHNGIKNIIKMLGTEKFNRLRIGIDAPPINFKIVDWVLNRMSEDEIEIIKQNITNIKKFVLEFVQSQDFKKIMNLFNK